MTDRAPTYARQPENVGEMIVRHDRMFNHGTTGDPVQRERVCACGKAFTQTQLSERFVELVGRMNGEKAIAIMARQIPDFYVPVHCPKCERIDLGHASRIADHVETYHDQAA